MFWRDPRDSELQLRPLGLGRGPGGGLLAGLGGPCGSLPAGLGGPGGVLEGAVLGGEEAELLWDLLLGLALHVEAEPDQQIVDLRTAHVRQGDALWGGSGESQEEEQDFHRIPAPFQRFPGEAAYWSWLRIQQLG